MAIEYDRLNQAYAAIRTIREEFLRGTITKEELDAMETKIRADIRGILGFEPVA
ncbi:MAG: hypothetical protein KAT75_00635 [Dehalococcoidia bacterium]|nr:hypothetical protein [Dehalococcoidia bacterium]